MITTPIKIIYKKFNNKVAELKIKAMKEKERKDLVNCQLKNCYNLQDFR